MAREERAAEGVGEVGVVAPMGEIIGGLPLGNLVDVVASISTIIKEFDATSPQYRNYRAGAGPFSETELTKEICRSLNRLGILATTQRTPDLAIGTEWAIEFKLVRPFGDNGKEAENWTVNATHPYPGNTSALSDAMKLQLQTQFQHKAVVIVGYEHEEPLISLEPLIRSFEAIAEHVLEIPLGIRVQATSRGLIHPVLQVLQVYGWEVG